MRTNDHQKYNEASPNRKTQTRKTTNTFAWSFVAVTASWKRWFVFLLCWVLPSSCSLCFFFARFHLLRGSSSGFLCLGCSWNSNAKHSISLKLYSSLLDFKEQNRVLWSRFVTYQNTSKPWLTNKTNFLYFTFQLPKI